jgi:hypothetical protein
MPERTIEDSLREEYFDLLPEIRRVLWQLEAVIRYHTLTILHALKKPEQLIVKSHVKDCESAIETLGRISKGEGRRFDPDRPDDYSILQLPDLAGVRVPVFPNRRMDEVDDLLRTPFPDWNAKPVKDDSGSVLARKYFGFCSDASDRVCGEYQIVPMLLGLFWEVEHSAMYKFRAVANSKEMRNRRAGVESALAEFEKGVERFL